MATQETHKEPRKNAKFYDSATTIGAMQREPFENGFTWRTVLGMLFIAFVMLPGIIFMSLMLGVNIGGAADWVVIILFVELARRSFVALRKQEIYILRYALGNIGTGIFGIFVLNRYLRNSEDFQNFGISHQVPDWFAPLGDAAFSNGFLSKIWLPAIAVALTAMILHKLSSLAIGFLAFKLTADAEKLPFPLAPIHAEGAIALAETSQDKRKKGYRQYCFAVGSMLGVAFGLFYVAIPILSQAFLGTTIQFFPIPFLDLTQSLQHIIPGGTLGICFDMGLLFVGFVLPWRIVVGMFATNLTFQIILNPIFQRMGWLPHWVPGKDAIQTQVANNLDLYLSLGIGFGLAVFIVGVYSMIKGLVSFARKKQHSATSLDMRRFWERNKQRGDPPTWLAIVVWFTAATSLVVFCNYLINNGVPEKERFSVWWLIAFAYFWSPMNTYVNARMAGIAGQAAGVPYLKEAAIFSSGYKHVNIWFTPLPLENAGQVADFLKQTELTRTRFTSILKVEVLAIPLVLLASYLFWSYIVNLGPIPSDSYPYIQKFWPQNAQMSALWASSMQEGQSLMLESLKPSLILTGVAGVLTLFAGFSIAGISTQFIYGGIGAINSYPHMTIMIFIGACLGRFILAPKFGKDKWQNFAPILAVGFGVGVGLIGMVSIAINFLWVSIGMRY
jgi:hypothetical protein